VVRISPQSQHMVEIVNAFSRVLAEPSLAVETSEAMAGMMPEQPCNGYWYGKPGLEQLAAEPQHA